MKKYIITILLTLFLLNLSVLEIRDQSQILSNYEITKESDDKTEIDQKLSDIDVEVLINASDIIRELPADAIGTAISYIHNGSEILDPETLDFYEGIVQKYADMNPGTIRFPGGSLSQEYQWWEGIGPQANRPMGDNMFSHDDKTTNNYGIDEHIDLCDGSGAKPTITVNFHNGTPLEAANWVEYCNGEIPDPADTIGWTVNDFVGNEAAPDGYFAWLRGQYGNSEPYNIINWEIGNEVYDNWTKTYNATEYGNRFILFNNSMKAVDPTIKLAAVGYENATGYWNESLRDTKRWNEEVARVAGDAMDAINVHMYAPVGDDGRTVYFTWNYEVLKRIKIPQEGNYTLLLTAKGLDLQTYSYPSNGFANLSINVDSKSVANVSITMSNPRIYNVTLNFTNPGEYNIGVEMLNTESNRMAMMLGDLVLKNSTNEILIQYKNESLLYDSIMACGLYYKDEITDLQEIFETETGRTDIEVWITEYNTFYNTIGFSRDQQFEFKSAVAMADMAVQFIYGGADIVQVHNSLDDYFFGLIHEGKTLADSSMYDTYSLLIESWGQYLLNSSVICPTFDLIEKFGWVPARSNVPYLDVLPTLTGNDLSVLLINKHPTEAMNVSLDIEGFNSTKLANLKTINSSSITSLDYNPPDNSYEYYPGKVGNAIRLNDSLPIEYRAFRKVSPREGTLEFWIKPEWDGDDQLNHSILSIGGTFQLSKYYENLNEGLVLIIFSDAYDEYRLVFDPIINWKAGIWQHVAITWDISDYLTMYINGTPTSSVSFKDFKTFFDFEQPMVIGSKVSDESGGLNGCIDELRFFKVARSGTQIQADFNAGVAGLPLTVDENTTIYLPFNNSLEDRVEDQRTYISTKTIEFDSSGGLIILPRCSISLLTLEKFQKPCDCDSVDDDDDDDDDDDTADTGAIPSYDTMIIYCLILTVPIFVVRKIRRDKHIL